MEDCNPGNNEKSEVTYVEKKCEREFKKLLQAVDYKAVNVTYCKHKCSYPGNLKKKHKADASSVDNKSSSSFGVSSISLICTADGFRQKRFDLNNLYEELKRKNKLEMRCQSLIQLAVFCSGEISETELSIVINALDLLSDSHESDALAVGHTLLLLALTTKSLTLDQLTNVEESILNVANSVSLAKNAFKSNVDVPSLANLKGEQYWTACKLCQKLFADECQDIDSVDVLTICCSALRNLSSCPIGSKYKYSHCTLKFILGMTGKATQEIVSENLGNTEDCPSVSTPTYGVNRCLKILEHMLSVDPDMQFRNLDHEDFSLLHCLTRLLGWCISFSFGTEQCGTDLVNKNSFPTFHLSTLISILKILSVLSFNPDQYDSFTNIKGLMEKVMICILKAYFHSNENRFDVLILALELMINFYLRSKKTFVLLCLKRFQINSEEIRSIEALLKMLANSLEKINEIKTKSFKPEEEEKTKNSEVAEMKFVLEIADEDMELSTIVSFISILLMFFMDTKKSFLEFIRARLSLEASEEAITVSKKVLQFASLTGGMPITGILLLRHAIKKLSRLYRSS